MRKFYGFSYWSGVNTTTGQPNEKTGYHTIAGDLLAFSTLKKRETWVGEGKVTSDMQGNCRVKLTKPEVRKHFLDMSICSFTAMIEDIEIEE